MAVGSKPGFSQKFWSSMEVGQRLLGIGQALRVVVVRGHREQGAAGAHERAEQHEDDGDGDEDAAEDVRAAWCRSPGGGALPALSPRE
jgi:hypothetical protein